MMASQQPGIGKVVVGKSEKEKAEEKKEGVTLYVSLFFDGTLNNSYNTTLRITANNVLAKKRQNPNYLPSEGEEGQLDAYEDVGDSDSYANYYSNVALLSYLNKKRIPSKQQVSVYVEGAGTDFEEETDDNNKREVTYKGDSTLGYSTGTGDTGIPDKVQKGIDKVRKQIKEGKIYKPKRQFIAEIKVDVFGFSRGAAEARHFISRRNELSEWPDQQPARVSVQFAGLFDTVSSYGRDFLDDVGQLKLAVGGQARKVVHLVAGDEYRANFASTNIRSSIAANVGYELVLPGVHSDVGGGYAEVELEKHEFYRPHELRRFIGEGWFRQDPDRRKNQVIATTDEDGEFHAWTQRKVYYQYQLIPLAIMVALAHKSGLGLELGDFDAQSMSFTGANGPSYNVPARLPQLTRLRRTMGGFALANDGAHRVTFALPPTEEAKRVRNLYLHRSEQARSSVSAPRWNEHQQLERKPIDG